MPVLGQDAPEVAAILADSGAAGRRHLVRSCRGAPCRRLPTARPGASKADPKEGLLGLQRCVKKLEIRPTEKSASKIPKVRGGDQRLLEKTHI